jgi:hypothetical protein
MAVEASAAKSKPVNKLRMIPSRSEMSGRKLAEIRAAGQAVEIGKLLSGPEAILQI